MARFRKGTAVLWNWGVHTAHGKAAETFTEDISRTIEGAEITHKASRDEPAYGHADIDRAALLGRCM